MKKNLANPPLLDGAPDRVPIEGACFDCIPSASRRGYLHTHITHIYLCRTTDAAAGGAGDEGRKDDDAGHGDPKGKLGNDEIVKQAEMWI